jgi:hypothetical protein
VATTSCGDLKIYQGPASDPYSRSEPQSEVVMATSRGMGLVVATISTACWGAPRARREHARGCEEQPRLK